MNFESGVYTVIPTIFKDDLENILGKRPYKSNEEKIEEAKNK